MAASLKPPREQPAASSSQPKHNKRSRAQARSQNDQPPFSQSANFATVIDVAFCLYPVELFDTPEFLTALTTVAQLLKVPVQTDDPAKLLKTTLAVAQRVLSPVALEAAAAAAQHSRQEGGDSTMFGLSKSQFPLGFEMGGERIR
eukprot:1953912-Pyramimonas_sp.AAC.1